MTGTRPMTRRNTCSGKSKFLLLTLAALAVFQPGFAEDQDIEQLRNAAEQGFDGAQVDLGIVYAKGAGVPQDYREAVKWYRRAANQGYARAQILLAAMYVVGKGVLEDYVEAYAWMILAATQGHEDAVKGKDELRSKMTAEQIAEAQKLAAELFDRIESSKSD